jgi:hypothetical protein
MNILPVISPCRAHENANRSMLSELASAGIRRPSAATLPWWRCYSQTRFAAPSSPASTMQQLRTAMANLRLTTEAVEILLLRSETRTEPVTGACAVRAQPGPGCRVSSTSASRSLSHPLLTILWARGGLGSVAVREAGHGHGRRSVPPTSAGRDLRLKGEARCAGVSWLKLPTRVRHGLRAPPRTAGSSAWGERPELCWRIAVFAAIALFALSLRSGGLTFDEDSSFAIVREQIQFAHDVLFGTGERNFKSIPSDHAYYGLGTLLPAYFASYVWDVAVLGGPHVFSGHFSKILHLFAFAASVAGAWYTGRLVARLTGHLELRHIAASAMLLTPVWLGYGLFDYKDVPIATGFLAALYYGIIFLDDRRARSVFAFLTALLYLGAHRLAALGLAIPIAFLVALRAPVAPWVAFTVALYAVTPPAWREPLRFAAAAIDSMAQHAWPGCTLTAGACIGRNYHNATGYWALKYIALWHGAQLPLAVIVGLFAAGIAYVRRFPMLNWSKHVVAASMAWPLAAIAWRNSSLYDGIRHTLFLVPLAVAIAITMAFTWRSKLAQARQARLLLAAYVVLMAVDGASLHPYEYTWFNECGRVYANERNYETDYWGFSLREATERANRERRPQEPLYGNPSHLVQPFATPRAAVAQERDLPSGTSFILVMSTRKGRTVMSNECQLLGFIKRRQLLFGRIVRLASISRCRKP